MANGNQHLTSSKQLETINALRERIEAAQRGEPVDQKMVDGLVIVVREYKIASKGDFVRAGRPYKQGDTALFEFPGVNLDRHQAGSWMHYMLGLEALVQSDESGKKPNHRGQLLSDCWQALSLAGSQEFRRLKELAEMEQRKISEAGRLAAVAVQVELMAKRLGLKAQPTDKAASPSKGTPTSPATTTSGRPKSDPPHSVGRKGGPLTQEGIAFRVGRALDRNLEDDTRDEDATAAIQRAGSWAFGLVLREECSQEIRHALMEAVRCTLQTRVMREVEGIKLSEVTSFLRRVEEDAAKQHRRNGGDVKQQRAASPGPVQFFPDEQEATPTNVGAPTTTATATDEVPQGAPSEEEASPSHDDVPAEVEVDARSAEAPQGDDEEFSAILAKVESYKNGQVKERLTPDEIVQAIPYYQSVLRDESLTNVSRARAGQIVVMLEGLQKPLRSPAKARRRQKAHRAAEATPTNVGAPTTTATATSDATPSLEGSATTPSVDEAPQGALSEEKVPAHDVPAEVEVDARSAEAPQGDGRNGDSVSPPAYSPEVQARRVMQDIGQEFWSQTERTVESAKGLAAEILASDLSKKDDMALEMIECIDACRRQLEITIAQLLQMVESAQADKEAAA